MWSADQTYMKTCMTKLSLTSSLVDLSRHMCLPRLHFKANLWPRLCLAGETTQCPSRTRRHRSQGKCQESSCIFLFFFAFSFVDWTLKYAELLLDASQLPHRLRRCSQSRSGAWAGTYGWGESIDRSPWSCPTASERWENNNGTHIDLVHMPFSIRNASISWSWVNLSRYEAHVKCVLSSWKISHGIIPSDQTFERSVSIECLHGDESTQKKLDQMFVQVDLLHFSHDGPFLPRGLPQSWNGLRKSQTTL